VIQPIFPIPLGVYDLEREFDNSEIEYFNSLKLSENKHNHISIDGYVLKNKKMKYLNKFLLDSLKDYTKHTYDFKSDIELYITQSWINSSKPKEYHHKHSHSNSIISGVFYIETDNEKDRIQFSKDISIYREGVFDFECCNDNDFNSEIRWFPAITKRLYLFPSGLEHDVPIIESRTKIRRSLSFNTFVKGTIGYDDKKTELII
jgi:uncharacterized protein (TIGR02466 family)